MIQFVLAAPASGSGKTTLTCALLAALKKRGFCPCAFKSGPDYIDPMFHRSALRVDSHNLDLFFSAPDTVRALYAHYAAGHDAALCEGAMGFYDGLNCTTTASAWALADTLGLPVLLVVQPKGASVTLAAQINGLKNFRTPSHLAGILLNDCSPRLHQLLAPLLERETGLPVLGYLPHLPDAVVESRHLGLKTAGEIAGVLPTVLFCPEDLMILKMGASQRRRFGDLALCALRPNYDAALTEYNRILEQKSRILKDHFENPGILEILPEYNTRLCQVGALLISYRARFYDSLGKAAANYHNQFSGGAENFTLSYKTVSTVIDPFAPVPELTQNLLDHLQSHSRAELETAQCLTGPHKDDFTVSLSGIDLKAYGSQGQTRTAAISLKLAQRELMAREWGEEPVLLLDDVLSELDPGRQDFVLNKIVSGQVFITCCEPGRFTKLGRTIQIEKGSIRE